jgi:hypothetical protein
MDIWSILLTFGILYGHFLVIWYIVPRVRKLYEEKSANPVQEENEPFARAAFSPEKICSNRRT